VTISLGVICPLPWYSTGSRQISQVYSNGASRCHAAPCGCWTTQALARPAASLQSVDSNIWWGAKVTGLIASSAFDAKNLGLGARREPAPARKVTAAH